MPNRKRRATGREGARREQQALDLPDDGLRTCPVCEGQPTSHGFTCPACNGKRLVTEETYERLFRLGQA